MLIRILPSVGSSALYNSIAEHVLEAGHDVSGIIEGSSYVIGLIDSSWIDIPPSQRIILKDPAKVDSVPSEAILFNVFTLILIGEPRMYLYDFLKSAPDPLQ